jgi:hypothetical protein
VIGPLLAPGRGWRPRPSSSTSFHGYDGGGRPDHAGRRAAHPFYAGTAASWPLAPRADQELAGVLMWVVGPLAYLAAGTLLFFRWASLEEADTGPAVAPDPR